MRKLLLFACVLFFANASAQLNGTYIIGAGQTYTTLAAAVTALNANGISGNVTLLLDQNQTATSAYVLNQFTGSGTYTTTIKPNVGKNITVQVNNVDANSQTNAVFEFNGADRIVLNGNNGTSDDNLTLFRNNTNQNFAHSVVMLYNTAEYNVIKNLIIKSTTGNANALSYGITAGGSTVASSGNNSNNEIDNVLFTSVFYPVYVSGSSTANTNWTVKNSTVNSGTGARSGFYLGNTANATVSSNAIGSVTYTGETGTLAGIYITGNNASVSDNTINSFTFTTSNKDLYGIYVSGSDALVTRNTVSNLTSVGQINIYGAYLVGSGATVSYNEIFKVSSFGVDNLAAGVYMDGATSYLYNNMISDVRLTFANNSGGGHGIYLTNGTSAKLYFNTVRLSDTQTGGRSASLFVNSGTSLDVRNNIFVNAQTSGGSRYAVYSNVAASSYTDINYNDYQASQYIGYLSANQTTLANWKAATGKDANSINVTPVFLSASDLHINDTNAGNLANLDAKGTPITGITNDIDLETRNTIAPDMGADEFGSKCPNSTTWNGTSWSNGTPSLTVKAIINGNYTTSTAGIKACELVVNANYTLTITEDSVVEVQNDVTVNGSLIINDKGSLVQNDDAAISTGNITMKRKTTAIKQYDYTYWSSPVVGATLSTVANGGPSVFYSFNTTANDYAAQSSSTVMAKGVGYISRAPGNLTYNPTQVLEVSFTGVPNTGAFTVQAIKATGSANANLIGNPYPSALDANAFISNSTNAAALTGTIYIWTHNKAISASNPGNNAYNYSADDYAKYNLSGGTKAASYSSGGTVPNGKIAAGQGFFVETSGSVGTKTLVFNNSMRVKTAAQNGQFFRNSNPATATVEQGTEIQKNRVWLSLTNDDGAYNEMLLAYITGATNGLDYGYDGKFFDGGNFVSIYSIQDNELLSIQGRDVNFDQNDVVPLGYISTIAGTLKIGLEDMDGFFSQNQDVFLLDKTTNVLTNLKTGSYTFTTEIGTINDRFELRFTDSALGTDLPVLDQHTVGVIKSGNQIQVKSSVETIASVTIYDLLGRMIFVKNNIGSQDFTTNELAVQNQAVVVKIKTANNLEIVKKVML